MAYKLVVFDLDGTLLNTLDDLAFSTNEALAEHGMPPRTIEEVRQFVGNGIAMLIERAVPAGTDEASKGAVLESFKRSYALHASDTTRPYPGIPEMLNALREHGVKTALVSNKGDFAVQKLVHDYFPDAFDIALGEREGIAKKPAPDMVDYVLAQTGIPKEQMVYVGDSEVDFATARNAGCSLILCSWGFRSVETLRALGEASLVDSTDELLAQLLA